MPDITTGNDGSVKISVDFDISEAKTSLGDIKKILEKFSSQVEKSFDKLATTLNKVQGTLEETAKTQKQMAQSAEESAKSNSENTNTLKAMLSVLRSVNASMSDFSKTQRQVSDGAKSNVSSMMKEYEYLKSSVSNLQEENKRLIQQFDDLQKKYKEVKQTQKQPTAENASIKNIKETLHQQNSINEAINYQSSAILRATENLKRQQIVVETLKKQLSDLSSKITTPEAINISKKLQPILNERKVLQEMIRSYEEDIKATTDTNEIAFYNSQIKRQEELLRALDQRYAELYEKVKLLNNEQNKISYLSKLPSYQQLIQKLELATLREQRYQAVLEETIAKQEKKNSSNEKASKSTEKMGKSATKTAHYLDSLSHYMGESAEETDSFAKKMYDAVRATTRAVTPINSVNNSLLNLGKRILNTAKSALLFSVLYRAFNQLSSVVSAVAMQNQTFANSLAQIKANLWTAFAPIWNAALPALNALMSALAEITGYLAAFIAMLFGKSVKVTQKQGEALQQQAGAADVAADSLDDVAGSAGDVADGMSDAAEATAEANKELAAYDKLNVINIEKPDTGAGDSGGGGGGSGGGGGGTGGIGNIVEAEPVIEELNDLDPKVFEKIKKRLEDILDIVISIGAAFAAWKIANILNNLFDLDLKLRQLVGITMMVGGFTLSFTGWENVGKGEADLIDALKIIIGSALGIAGSLLTFGTGPLGWTIGIGAAITVAIIGISVGQSEKLKEEIAKSFYQYTEGAISITVLADAYENLVSTVISANQPIIETGKTIEGLKDSNFIASQSFESIVSAINMGLYDAGEKLPQLTSLFEEMSSNVRTILDGSYDIIVTALAGSLGAVLEAAGEDTSAYTRLIAKAKGIADENYESYMQQKAELDAALKEGTITEEEYANKLLEIAKNISSITDIDLSTYTNQIDTLKRSVNWTDEEERNNALTKISEISKEAEESIDQSIEDIVESLEVYKKQLTDPLEIESIDQLIDFTKMEFKEASIKPVEEQILKVFDTIQSDVVSEFGNTSQTAFENWQSRGFFGGNLRGVLESAKNEYINGYVNPISDVIEQSLNELGIDGEIWMEDVISDISNPMSTAKVSPQDWLSSLYTEINQQIQQHTTVSTETAEQSGQEIGDSLYGGLGASANEKLTPAVSGLSNQLINGLFDIQTNTQPTAQSTGGAISSSLVSSLLSTDMATVFGQGSPIYTTGISNLGVLKNGLTSTAKTVGADTMTSLSDGVDNNSSLPENSLTLVGEAMKNSFFSVLGISSGSSSEMYNAATYTIAGLTSGIDVSAANPNNSIKKVGDTLVSTTKSIFGIKGGKSSVYDAFGTSLGTDLSLGIDISGKKARNSMITTLNGINTTTNRMAGTISGSFRSMFNNILGYASTFANRLVNSVTSALSKVNVATSSARVGSSGRLTYSIPSSVYVPKLAKGAVLPANQPFLAMVGDQKRGTNVEAPLETIKQGLREVLGEVDLGGNVNVYLQGDARDIFRVVKIENDKYKKQTGGSGL